MVLLKKGNVIVAVLTDDGDVIRFEDLPVSEQERIRDSELASVKLKYKNKITVVEE